MPPPPIVAARSLPVAQPHARIRCSESSEAPTFEQRVICRCGPRRSGEERQMDRHDVLNRGGQPDSAGTVRAQVMEELWIWKTLLQR
jgi:hypothetical protein